MSKDDIRRTLEKQLQLLSERSSEQRMVNSGETAQMMAILSEREINELSESEKNELDEEAKALESGDTTINAVRQRHGLPPLKDDIGDPLLIKLNWPDSA